MNNQEILIKAIEKAIANGWDGKLPPHYNVQTNFDTETGLNVLIFNHNFAKCLWGEEMVSTFPWAEDGSFKYETRVKAWMHHLQQMVIADDPIKYLGENLPDATDTDSDVLTASELESQDGDTGGQT